MAKPLPKVTDENETYWYGLREGKLFVQRCVSCRSLQFYPRFFCTHCHGRELEWHETKGTGTVYTFTVIRRPPVEAFKDDVPYILALVELDEGIRIMTRIVNLAPEECAVGMPVQLALRELEKDVVLPMFAPME